MPALPMKILAFWRCHGKQMQNTQNLVQGINIQLIIKSLGKCSNTSSRKKIIHWISLKDKNKLDGSPATKELKQGCYTSPTIFNTYLEQALGLWKKKKKNRQ
jgi:hypothetical protein